MQLSVSRGLGVTVPSGFVWVGRGTAGRGGTADVGIAPNVFSFYSVLFFGYVKQDVFAELGPGGPRTCGGMA